MLKTRGDLSCKKIYTACVQLNRMHQSDYDTTRKIATTV
jgi:hypothetical protein